MNPTHRPIFLPHGVNNGGGVHPTCHPFFLHLITCIWGLPFLRGLTTLQGCDSHTACPFSVCLSPNGGVMTSTQWGGVCRGSANPTCCPLSTLLQCWQGSVNATCCPFLFVHNTVVCIVSFCPHFPSFPLASMKTTRQHDIHTLPTFSSSSPPWALTKTMGWHDIHTLPTSFFFSLPSVNEDNGGSVISTCCLHFPLYTF